MVGLTNDDPKDTPPLFKSSYTVCAQYNGSVTAGASATVDCSSSTEKFRFVIIQGSHENASALCLTEVYVSAKSKHSHSADVVVT